MPACVHHLPSNVLPLYEFSVHSLQQFPYPPYTRDTFLQSMGSFLPLLLVMAFLYSAGIFVKVREPHPFPSPSLVPCCVTAGTCSGEGVTYKGVDVDDGTQAMDPLVFLVPQTVPLSLHHCHHFHYPPEGM